VLRGLNVMLSRLHGVGVSVPEGVSASVGGRLRIS
jgi:hypothetical protein